MLTAACLALLCVALGGGALIGYSIGSTRRLRTGEGYLAGRASGYQAGIRHGEKARTALQARVDQLDAALDEMGERYDQLLAQRFVPIATAAVAEVYDHEETGL